MRLRPPSPLPRGFSIIELMVAMLIGLIGTIIIFQVFEVSEGIKRTTTSGGDAQQNGAVALYVMERDLRNAGMGFNDTPYAGCAIRGWDSSRTPQAFPAVGTSMPMAPVYVVPGASNAVPDQISVFYGSQTHVMSATPVTANMGAATDPLRVINRYGFRAGDLILLHEPSTTKECALMEVTAIPATPSDQINHDVGTYTLPATGNAVTARFNPVGGMTSSLGAPLVYAGASTVNATRIFNLGNLYDANGATLPVYNTYAVTNNTLTVASAISPGAPATIADNIVQLRALYALDDGVDNGTVSYTPALPFTAGDGRIDRFVDGTTFNALPAPQPWRYVIAMRIALVARSALAEKPLGSDGAKCDATTDGSEATPGPDRRPKWSVGVIDVSASGDPDPASPLYWKCYRYRVFETTIPLRNWIWKAS